MPNTNKQLAELLVEEKKLLEQKKKEQDALKQKLRTVKKQLREEERKLNERRAALLGHCMMQKFNSERESKEAILQDLDGFLSKLEERELFGLLANRLLQEKVPETFLESFLIPRIACLMRRAAASVVSTHGHHGAPTWHRSGKPFSGLCAYGCRVRMAQRTARH